METLKIVGRAELKLPERTANDASQLHLRAVHTSKSSLQGLGTEWKMLHVFCLILFAVCNETSTVRCSCTYPSQLKLTVPLLVWDQTNPATLKMQSKLLFRY